MVTETTNIAQECCQDLHNDILETIPYDTAVKIGVGDYSNLNTI